MNLYKKTFEHYSQKDSKTGIKYLFIAEDERDAYNKLRDECNWEYSEDDDGDFKERIIKCGGQMFDDYYEPSDLYYGATAYGWELVKEDVTEEEVKILVGLTLLQENK